MPKYKANPYHHDQPGSPWYIGPAIDQNYLTQAQALYVAFALNAEADKLNLSAGDGTAKNWRCIEHPQAEYQEGI